MQDIISELQQRHLVEKISSPALADILRQESVAFYCGFDPTAPSLQIGNLCAVLVMRRLQEAGHKPVTVIGGATGMIGDPSGRSSERQLLDEETLRRNLEAQRGQLSRFLDFHGPCAACLLNNRDWLGDSNLIAFLRDIGKHFRLGEMLARESVRRRLDSEAGMSFTEFSYQILQAYDFLHLHRRHGVRLQIGGSDQWGNITAGIDLIRRLEGKEAYGMVMPLVTDSQGRKFGKSEVGAIYLDAALTSPYQMYQYLLNSDDQSVIRYLKIFTFLPLEEIADLEKETCARPEARQAQRVLAQSVVKLVHGQAAAAAAERASRILFGEAIRDLTDDELDAIFNDVPSVTLPRSRLADGINIIDLLALVAPLFKSKGDARRALEQGGVYLNNQPVDSSTRTITAADLASATMLVVRRGKKNYCLVRAV